MIKEKRKKKKEKRKKKKEKRKKRKKEKKKKRKKEKIYNGEKYPIIYFNYYLMFLHMTVVQYSFVYFTDDLGTLPCK